MSVPFQLFRIPALLNINPKRQLWFGRAAQVIVTKIDISRNSFAFYALHKSVLVL
jgi:hypothetical protein